MKVKELIKHLQQLKNQEADVYVTNSDPSGYSVALKLRPRDIKQNQKLMADNIEMDLWDDETDKYIGPKVVTIRLDY